MGSIRKELEVEADVKKLKTVISFIDKQLGEVSCPERAQFRIELSVEEIFVNIASYAYAPGTGTVRIETSISDDPPEAEITFIDRGVRYDPLARTDPDVTLPAEQRKSGGLGIFLTKKNMDSVSYEYRDGCNVLVMKKQLARG